MFSFVCALSSGSDENRLKCALEASVRTTVAANKNNSVLLSGTIVEMSLDPKVR
jgi:hypothetical protein